MTDFLDRISGLSPKRLALLADSLQERLQESERSKTEPIAVIGMGCRFPGATSPEAFWRLLREGVDTITEVPLQRWNIDEYYDPDPEAPDKMYTRYGAFVEGVEDFDAQLFGIAPREAIRMDPQQRLLLEVAWEALENAGQAPGHSGESQTGVFIGAGASSYAGGMHLGDNDTGIDPYSGTGNVLCVAAGRLAYVLGLCGPNLPVDTACSSSLVATHLACSSLRSRECDMALVAGVNLTLSPEPTVYFCKVGVLSPEGRCKTFDASADGYVRGEGCGAVVLKRLSDARADGDPILAVIRGSHVNHDGRSTGLTVPNRRAQEAVIRKALQRAGVSPGEVGYLEAHGTGTPLGDPIEIQALGAVFGAGRSPRDPLIVGSVKTNLGHLEAAAGIAGLIKVILALQHDGIPPHLHFRKPNPYIAWNELPIEIPTRYQPWPARSGRRIAGVSSFGFSGTNAHVVLEEAPPVEPKRSEFERGVHLLCLSAKTTAGRTAMAQRMARRMLDDEPAALGDVAYSANVGRSHFSHRLAVIAETTAEAREDLAAFASGEHSRRLRSAEVPVDRSPKVAFLFTGQGSQYAGMGRQLFETQPTFRRTLQRCDELLGPHLERSLLSVLYPQQGEASPLDETVYAQPALFALEYALAELWRSWGVRPAVAMGHGVGEYVAACVAGVMSLEDALTLVARRGRLMQSVSPRGAMAAVLADPSRTAAAIAPYCEQVSIAAFNGPRNTVISGSEGAVQAVLKELASRGIEFRRLPVSHAFHSPLMEPMLAEFEEAAREVDYSPPRLGLLSNVSGRLAAAEEVGCAAYWRRHARQPVQFAPEVQTLDQRGYEVFLELGPDPTLLAMASRCVPEKGQKWLPSLRRRCDDRHQMLRTLRALYLYGVEIDWRGFDADYARTWVRLPTYPFERQRFWIDRGRKSEFFRRPKASRTPPGEWMYKICWDAKPRALARKPRETEADAAGSWLIFADDSGVGRQVARQLEEHGRQCVLVTCGREYRAIDRTTFQLDPSRGEDFDRLSKEIFPADSQQPCAGVVHLWSLDAPSLEEASHRSEALLQRGQNLACVSVLHLVQMLARLRGAKAPRLWLVSRGAQAAGPEQGKVCFEQATLWGLGRVIASEHPELRCTLLDLDPDLAAEEQTTELYLELCNGDDERQIVLRRGTRRVARLKPGDLPEVTSSPPVVRTDGTYLITGGLGALGLRVADWLVRQGAQYLLLLGRRAPAADAETGLRGLHEAGARVRILRADVARADQLAEALAQALGEEGWPSLRGIIHAAGVIDHDMLLQLDRRRLEAVLAPKVQGAFNLHRATLGESLDFFVFFSSAASLLGAMGLGSYSAANAFLDGLAAYRRCRKLPALTVNWGPWGETGMATRSGVSRRVTTGGYRLLPPQRALDALGRLLECRVVQRAVLDVDFSQLLRYSPDPSTIPPLLREIRIKRSHAIALPDLADEFLNLSAELAAAEPADRHDLLESFLVAQLAKALGVEPDQVDRNQPLTTMGIDSLMAIQVKNTLESRLNVALPVAELLEGPSVAKITRRILEVQFIDERPRPPIPRVSRTENLPLSFAQERLWFMNQLEPKSAFYNISTAVRVSGNLDVAVLRDSLNQIVARHEVLRTTFPAVDGRPMQRIAPELPFDLTVIDLNELPEDEREAVVQRRVNEDACRPFDLSQDVLRACLLRLDAVEHVFLLTMHHIISDGWSLVVLVRELAALYEAFSAGRPSPLPALPVQYADFAVWQRKWLSGEVLQGQLDYWVDQLGDAPKVLELPADRPRPAMQTFCGTQHGFVLPAELSAALRRLSREHQATMFMTLLAAFQSLLSRYCGQDQVCVGTPIAGRNRSEIEGLIGFFVNTIVLRADLSGDPSFVELLSQVREVTLQAYAHQDVPFEQLVDLLQPLRDLSRSPLVQVMFTTLPNLSALELASSGLAFSFVETQSGTSKFDLILSVAETGSELVGSIEYNTDLFDASTIERLVGHYQELLAAVVDDPGQRVFSIPLQGAAKAAAQGSPADTVADGDDSFDFEAVP